MNFSIKKKGYNPSEVDDYSLQAEQYLQSQKERIIGLKNKVAALEKELEIYREKKDLIVAALSEAIKKSEEIEHHANQKYDLEIQRLRQFHAKWTDYYDKLIKKTPAITKNTDNFNREMDKILRENEWCLDTNPKFDDNEFDKEDLFYKNEKKRLAEREENIDAAQNLPHSASKARTTNDVNNEDSAALTPLERIKKYLDGGFEDAVNVDNYTIPQAKEEQQRVFSLEEALNPKQDLESIMRDLGLIEE